MDELGKLCKGDSEQVVPVKIGKPDLLSAMGFLFRHILSSVGFKTCAGTLVLFASMFCCELCSAQTSDWQAFKQLPGPEKRWVLTHLWVARKAQRISARAVQYADSLGRTGELDNDHQGGRIDAFRHSFWMAMLSSRMGWRKARRLGIAHEKGDYIRFKNGELEQGTIADAKAGEMDLFNNEAGLKIGRENKRHSEAVIAQLTIWSIRAGMMRMIRKNEFGRSLDCDGNFIPDDDWMGSWENRRCLVPTD